MSDKACLRASLLYVGGPCIIDAADIAMASLLLLKDFFKLLIFITGS